MTDKSPITVDANPTCDFTLEAYADLLRQWIGQHCRMPLVNETREPGALNHSFSLPGGTNMKTSLTRTDGPVVITARIVLGVVRAKSDSELQNWMAIVNLGLDGPERVEEHEHGLVVLRMSLPSSLITPRQMARALDSLVERALTLSRRISKELEVLPGSTR